MFQKGNFPELQELIKLTNFKLYFKRLLEKHRKTFYDLKNFKL